MITIRKVSGTSNIKNENVSCSSGLSALIIMKVNGDELVKAGDGMKFIKYFDSRTRSKTKKVKIKVEDTEYEVYSNDEESEFYLTKRLVTKLDKILNKGEQMSTEVVGEIKVKDLVIGQKLMDLDVAGDNVLNRILNDHICTYVDEETKHLVIYYDEGNGHAMCLTNPIEYKTEEERDSYLDIYHTQNINGLFYSEFLSKADAVIRSSNGELSPSNPDHLKMIKSAVVGYIAGDRDLFDKILSKNSLLDENDVIRKVFAMNADDFMIDNSMFMTPGFYLSKLGVNGRRFSLELMDNLVIVVE